MTEQITTERCQKCGHDPAYHGAGFCACVVGTPPGVKCDCYTFTPFRPDRPVGVSEEDVAREIALHYNTQCADYTPVFCECGEKLDGYEPGYHMAHQARALVALFVRPPVVVDAGRVERAYREAWADFEANPKSQIAFGRMDALAAVLQAFTSGVITLNPAKAYDGRCPLCFGLNGVHGVIHERFPQGGGGTNKPCPLGLTVTGETK